MLDEPKSNCRYMKGGLVFVCFCVCARHSFGTKVYKRSAQFSLAQRQWTARGPWIGRAVIKSNKCNRSCRQPGDKEQGSDKHIFTFACATEPLPLSPPRGSVRVLTKGLSTRRYSLWYDGLHSRTTVLLHKHT